MSITDEIKSQLSNEQLNDSLLARVYLYAKLCPQAPAFRSLRDGATSYEDLWKLAGMIAQNIKERVFDTNPVMVLGSKSALTVATFLACLRTGHAYVPLDISTPPQRIAAIYQQLAEGLSDGVLPLLIVCDEKYHAVQGIAQTQIIDVSAMAESSKQSLADAMHASPSTPASVLLESHSWVAGNEMQYIIFTSGSTGKPKGIEVSAANVAHFMHWMDTFPVVKDGGRTFLDQAPYSFDLSVYELVGALATGGCLYALSSEAAHDYGLLFKELRDSKVDVWVSTPPFADLCMADHSFSCELLPQLQLFLFCGDTLTHRSAHNLRTRFPEARIANTYGPTESTVAVTYCEVTDEMLASPEPLPVGYPRQGTTLLIMRAVKPGGELVEPCACGESGEIVICGNTVARGYYNDPVKNAQAFGTATLADSHVVPTFRTGDIGHLDEHGLLHYEGRIGSLVKVNGFRIELGDVENHLCALAGIKCAAVVPIIKEERVSSLRAFVVLDKNYLAQQRRAQANQSFQAQEQQRTQQSQAPQQLNSREIRRLLAQHLPAYMIPRSIKVLDHMPLTSNAKIDRKLLMAG